MMSTISPSPIITEFNEFAGTISSPKKRNISGIPSPKMLPDIVGPRQIIPTLHQKTHFKAATSVFLNHQGTLSHKENSDDTGRHVEKILNDINVKHNLQAILEKTSKHVTHLRSKHNQTPDIRLMMSQKPIKNTMDRLNQSFEGINDRDTASYVKQNTSGTMTTEISSPFAIAVKQVQRCPVEHNPLKEIMQEEGRNLSPSQVAKEMLYNCKVLRRKDFNV